MSLQQILTDAQAALKLARGRIKKDEAQGIREALKAIVGAAEALLAAPKPEPPAPEPAPEPLTPLEFATAVKALSEVFIESLAEPGPEPEPEPAPDPGPTTPSALEAAASAVLRGPAQGIQIAWIKPSHPRYEPLGIVGPLVIDGQDTSRIGQGETLAAAYADYKAKGGPKLGEERAMHPRELAEVNFFVTPGNVQAPSSLRRTGSPNVPLYACDFHRHGVAQEVTQKHPTIAGAVAEMREILGGNI